VESNRPHIGSGDSSNSSFLDTLRINRTSGVPLYLQLQDQIARLIEKEICPPGYRLPTERDLSRHLEVSRNTISLAYRNLAARGLVESHQGRGTFVSGAEPRTGSQKIPTDDDTHDLDHLVDSFFDRAAELGYDLTAIHETFHSQLQERRARLAEVRVAFVECNREQLDYFSRSLELGAGVHVMPVLLSELFAGESREELIRRVRSADLTVTTFFHLREVKQVLGQKVEVLGIALDPDMETMVKIAQLARDEPVGLLCSSNNFAQRVIKSMCQSGLDGLDIRIETSPEISVVHQLLREVGTLIVSPGRRSEVEEMADGRSVIEFIYKPDAGSINALQSRLLEKTRKE